MDHDYPAKVSHGGRQSDAKPVVAQKIGQKMLYSPQTIS